MLLHEGREAYDGWLSPVDGSFRVTLSEKTYALKYAVTQFTRNRRERGREAKMVSRWGSVEIKTNFSKIVIFL